MKCWSCGQNTMSPWGVLGKGWYKCLTCSATHTKMPKLYAFTFSVEGTLGSRSFIKGKAHPLPKSRRAKK